MFKYVFPAMFIARLSHPATVEHQVTTMSSQVSAHTVPESPVARMGKQPSVYDSHITYEDILPISRQITPSHPPVDVTGDSPLKRTKSFTTEKYVPYIPGVRLVASYGYGYKNAGSMLGYRVK